MAETQHESQRNHRRGSYAVATVLLVLAAALVVLQSVARHPFIPAPADVDPPPPDWLYLVSVMFFGAVGAALSGLVTLYVNTKEIPETLWFDPRPSLFVVKIVLGMWTAVIGLALVSTEAVVGNSRNFSSVILLALIFGYAQQAVTTFLDRKATQMLKT